MPQRKDELTINKAEEDFYGLEILIFRQGRIANPPERERENVPICRPQQEDRLAIYKAEEDFYGLEIISGWKILIS